MFTFDDHHKSKVAKLPLKAMSLIERKMFPNTVSCFRKGVVIPESTLRLHIF